MADAVAVTKADGANKASAESTRIVFKNALQMFPLTASGWKPDVVTCSAIDNNGIAEIWDLITDYVRFTGKNGYFEEWRKKQAVTRMHDAINEFLTYSFYKNKDVIKLKPALERQLYEGKITSFKAAQKLIDKYHKK